MTGLNKMCSFAQNIGLLPLAAILFKKVTLLCEGLEAICWELTEIFMKLCSFAQNIGLLPLVGIVLKNLPYFVKVWKQSIENWLR